MPRTTDRYTTRRILAAGLAAVAFTTVAPAAGHAAPAPASRTQAAAADAVADYPDRLAVADKFGHGDDFSLAALVNRDFVIAIWNIVKDNPDQSEVRLAAELAFTAAPEDAEQAASDFILTEVHAAFDRDTARELQEANDKRASDLARAAAAASIDVMADATMLAATDADFIRLIWERVAEDAKWPKVKAAAVAARNGTAAEQAAFIAAGLAATAKQDTDDRIAADEATSEAEKAAEMARNSKRTAASYIGLTATLEQANLPDLEFVMLLWKHATATRPGSEVESAAYAAVRSSDPAVWVAFIATGVQAAAGRDVQNALAEKAAADRELLQTVITQAVKLKQLALAAAARAALATGDAGTIADFLDKGRYQVGMDVKSVAVSGNRIGVITTDGSAWVKEGALDAPWRKMYSNKTKQLVLSGDRIGMVTTDNIAYVKEGALTASWVKQFDQIKKIAVDGGRIGLLTEDNVVRVKSGELNASLLSIHRDAKDFALSGTRIGVLTPAGDLVVKQGTIDATWRDLGGGVKQFALSQTRVAKIGTNDIGRVWEGSLSDSEWVQVHQDIKQIALDGDRIGVISAAGDVRVKEGALDAPFVNQRANSTAFALDGTRIIAIDANRVAAAKEGTLANKAWTIQRTAPNPN